MGVPDMNLKPFQYALVLAQAGSFSKAAEELGISQPSLSQYIKKAEQQAGVVLFDRTNNNVRPTDAGLVYLEIGRKALTLAHEMETRFSDIAAGKSGTVIVGTILRDAVPRLAELPDFVIQHAIQLRRRP